MPTGRVSRKRASVVFLCASRVCLLNGMIRLIRLGIDGRRTFCEKSSPEPPLKNLYKIWIDLQGSLHSPQARAVALEAEPPTTTVMGEGALVRPKDLMSEMRVPLLSLRAQILHFTSFRSRRTARTLPYPCDRFICREAEGQFTALFCVKLKVIIVSRETFLYAFSKCGK